MTWVFRVLPVFSLGCAAAQPTESASVAAPASAGAPTALSAPPAPPAQPPLDDGAGEASDRARLRPTACRETMAAYFRRHNDGASVAAILAEAAYGGYRSEIEGGAPCIDKRLKKAIFPPFERDGRGSAELFYGLYFALAHNPGFDRARAGGLLGCSDFRYDARAWRPAASEALEGGCAIPFAWTRRGLQKSELCLDIQVYALVLAMWTVSGGEPVNEDAFVNMVRYLSEQAPEHPSAKGSAAPPQCKR